MYDMREIGQGIDGAKERVKKLVGVPALIKVSTGRGKQIIFSGKVEAVFPAVFSVRLNTGELKTFSYADVHTRGVMFLDPSKHQ